MSKMANVLVAAGILLSACLTGCGPGVPQGIAPESSAVSSETATATPIATPTTTPAPSAAAISVDADGLTVAASDGSVLADIPYTTSVTTAVDQLTGILGAGPTTVDIPQSGNCSGAHSTFDWGGFLLRSPPALANGEFSVEVTAPVTFDGVSLRFADGLRVGSSMEEILASPLVQAGPGGGYLFDVRGDLNDTSGTSNPYGGYVGIESDLVSSFFAPSNYFYDC